MYGVVFMKYRSGIPGIIGAIFVLVFTAAASGRTWTDKQGKTINAKFVRLVKEDVVLKGGKVFRVPFSQLSVQDQGYVAEQLDKQRKGHLLPPVDKSRMWKDMQGKTISAKFVRIKEGNVVLWKTGGVQAFPFLDFSPKDRKYVRQLAKARQQENLLPPPAEDELQLDVSPVPPLKVKTKPRPKSHPRPRPASRPRPKSRPKAKPKTPPTTEFRLKCNKCYKTAPKGTPYGAPCTYCEAKNRQRKKRFEVLNKQYRNSTLPHSVMPPPISLPPDIGLKCDKCGTPAQPGAKPGDVCDRCKPSTAYRIGYMTGRICFYVGVSAIVLFGLWRLLRFVLD